MPKIIQLTEAQLKKVVSNVISEQGVTDPNVNPRIRKIFDTLVTSVAGPGTSLNQLLSAFQLMQSADDFYTMSRILKANQKSAKRKHLRIFLRNPFRLNHKTRTTKSSNQKPL
jgi:hypothetical protein